MSGSFASDFRRWFWARPRAHGEIIEGRRVSNVELLYDLVYVAVVSQTTAALSKNLSLAGVLEFVVIFSLTWIGWVNGTIYLELHGGDDGRTRSYVFLQMAILALLAVFTQNAASDMGAAFAVTYVAFLLVVGWLFFTVGKFDTAQMRRLTRAYAAIMFISAAVILFSAFLTPDLRLTVWAAFDIGWILLTIYVGARPRTYTIGVAPTDSMVERFDTFTLIVLGEVVVGVIAGMIAAPKEFVSLTTGVVALIVGLGFWWIYFDVVGGRRARRNGASITAWILAHLPITMAIAGAGAAMVGLVEHADDAVTPEWTAWVLAGGVAIVLLSEIVLALAFVDGERDRATYRPLLISMAVAAVLSVALGLLPIPPWTLAVALNAILLGVWFIAASRFMRAGAWPPGSASTAGESAALSTSEKSAAISPAGESAALD